MTFSKTGLLLQALMLLFVPAIFGEPDVDPEGRILIEGLIENAIQNALKPLANLSMPALPTIGIDIENIASVALSLTDLELKGLNLVKVDKVKTGSSQNPAVLYLNLPHVALTGLYSSGGNLINVPFNGEGPMSVTLHDLAITVTFGWETFRPLFSDYCASSNSTGIDLDLRRMEVVFENLNPGSDQGELVNTILSSFGPDIFDYLETFLDTTFYEAIDVAIVGSINAGDLCKSKPSEALPEIDLSEVDIDAFVQQLVEHFVEGNVRLTY
ncbi:uncharacterized protein LOC122264457 [Penaeus japonicus]|uniref:uncharacterized protein LOC122264457 n=1 Tax=Penaeus japonicus TaxID=27405 RepID=UPI001C714FF6|nr:uncharacterized protein LOC122264457 [Penaeus japonicus]